MASTKDGWREKIVGIAAILTLGIGLSALFLGFDWFWVVFVIGFAIVVPILAILFETDSDQKISDERSPRSDRQDALETLRDRYARGELTDEEFERKVEKLLENESIEQVEARMKRERERAER